VARAAAEAAARGDLEARLVEMEVAAADYRARAEAAERRLHVMDSPGTAPTIVEDASPVSSEAADGGQAAATEGPPEIDLRGIEAERDAAQAAAAAVDRQIAAARALQAQEITSLKAQLAAAERVRARAEADLAVAYARGGAGRAAAWAGEGAPVAAPARAAPNGDPGDPLPNPDLVTDGERPLGLAAPRGGRADDLRRIRGIGPKNEGVLNALGLYHYDQIAALAPENVAWLDAYMKFHGRIARDDWVGQAKLLMSLEDRHADKVHPQDAGA
jgi:predicted flap endonuclease-1-like 5' DNA nuclease